MLLIDSAYERKEGRGKREKGKGAPAKENEIETLEQMILIKMNYPDLVANRI